MKLYKKISVILISLLLSNAIHAGGIIESVKNLFTGHSDSESASQVKSNLVANKVFTHDPARRINHWKTVIKAFRAYGISQDSETMNWAARNLHRAESAAQFGRLPAPVRREVVKRKIKREIERVRTPRTRHETGARTTQTKSKATKSKLTEKKSRARHEIGARASAKKSKIKKSKSSK